MDAEVDRARLCPVCGFELWFEPWRCDSPADEICPSCGIQFGYHDAAGGDPNGRGAVYRQWRTRWIEKGMPWDSTGIEEPPLGWDPLEQLKRVTDQST